jgi:hypothetical protein
VVPIIYKFEGVFKEAKWKRQNKLTHYRVKSDGSGKSSIDRVITAESMFAAALFSPFSALSSLLFSALLFSPGGPKESVLGFT